MSYRKPAFAHSLLPKCYEARAKAEPKRNIVCVFKNDFSSQIQQALLATPPCGFTATRVPDAQARLRLLQFNMVVEPLRRIGQGADVMRLALAYSNHRDNQKHESGDLEQRTSDTGAGDRTDHREGGL